MNDTLIRHGVLSDIPYIYEICLKTGDSGKDASSLYKDPYLLGHYYAANYLLFNEGISFVVEHDNLVQGYIVAAPDTLAYNQWMEKSWLPDLRKRYPLVSSNNIVRSAAEERLIDKIHKPLVIDEKEMPPYIREYPAHLHVDLLPAIQRKGLGTILMDMLFIELALRGVPGLHLGVSSRNPGAQSFYNNAGYSILQKEEWGYTLGKACETN